MTSTFKASRFGLEKIGDGDPARICDHLFYWPASQMKMTRIGPELGP
jgi:hypothetical protein